MEYQKKKKKKLLDNTSNQRSKFRTKNWVEINGESRGTYITSSETKFKTTTLKSSLCDYSDACILVKGFITVNNTEAVDSAAHNANKKVIIRNSTSFTHYICEMNNTQTDNAKYIDIIMQMYNLI